MNGFYIVIPELSVKDYSYFLMDINTIIIYDNEPYILKEITRSTDDLDVEDESITMWEMIFYKSNKSMNEKTVIRDGLLQNLI